MTKHRYTLEKYKGPQTRYSCPGCGHHKRFTRYVDGETGGYVDRAVGRCDRVDSCQYHYAPRQFFADHPERGVVISAIAGTMAVTPAATTHVRPLQRAAGAATRVIAPPAIITQPEPEPSCIPMKMAIKTMIDIRHNNLLDWLYAHHPEREVDRLINYYHIGTSDHWPGATILWQIDRQERIRTGKIMLYDRDTGRRVKEPRAHIAWVHTALGDPDYRLRQCLYGENLLAVRDYQRLPVGVVESEKTAMVASILVPDILWMATGGKEGLTADRIAPLAGRKVCLYPDGGAYEAWSRRAHELRGLMQLRVSDLIERGLPGMDMADYV